MMPGTFPGGQLFSQNSATMAMGVLEKKVTMKARNELRSEASQLLMVRMSFHTCWVYYICCIDQQFAYTVANICKAISKQLPGTGFEQAHILWHFPAHGWRIFSATGPLLMLETCWDVSSSVWWPITRASLQEVEVI